MSAEDLPIGEPLPDWRPPPRPDGAALDGRYCRIEPLDIAHAEALHDAFAADTDGRNWVYLPYGPFDSSERFARWIDERVREPDPHFVAIVDRGSVRPLGVASWLRIAPEAGSIEVGHINLAPALQRTPAATEAMYLMMREAFRLGYRRYEWKCDALNARSRRAAERLGFAFEGVFRQATVYKGRNRDTAWYAVVDGDWPALERAFERWLDPGNFDAEGVQRRPLDAFREASAAASPAPAR